MARATATSVTATEGPATTLLARPDDRGGDAPRVEEGCALLKLGEDTVDVVELWVAAVEISVNESELELVFPDGAVGVELRLDEARAVTVKTSSVVTTIPSVLVNSNPSESVPIDMT